MKKYFALAALFGTIAPASAVTVSYGPVPASVTGTIVETFDVPPPTPSTLPQSFVSPLGTYTGVNVNNYGFGNGTNYAGAYVDVDFASPGAFSLTLTAPARYFGLLITSSDPSNKIDFYDGASLLFSYLVGTDFAGSSFVNFTFDNGPAFDSIIFTAAQSTGFESDNHTLAAAVPEPATWAMLIGGFGVAGVALRRRRSVAT